MKLQRQLSRIVGDTYYQKWTVVIPSDAIKQTGWKAGMDLEVEVKDKKIILKPKV